MIGVEWPRGSSQHRGRILLEGRRPVEGSVPLATPRRGRCPASTEAVRIGNWPATLRPDKARRPSRSPAPPGSRSGWDPAALVALLVGVPSIYCAHRLGIKPPGCEPKLDLAGIGLGMAMPDVTQSELAQRPVQLADLPEL